MNKKNWTIALLVVFIVIAFFLFFRVEEPVKYERPKEGEYLVANYSTATIMESKALNYSIPTNKLNITLIPTNKSNLAFISKNAEIYSLFENITAIDFTLHNPLLNRTPREPRIIKMFDDIQGMKKAIEVEWVDENNYTMVSYYVLEFENENFVENLTNKLFPKFTNNLSEIVFSRRLNILNQGIDEYKFSSGFLKDMGITVWSENRFAFVVLDTSEYDKESRKVAKWIVLKTEELKLGVKK